MSKIMNKVKETMKSGKEFVVDHRDAIFTGAVVGISLGCIAYGVMTGRKYSKMWRVAKEALDNGDMTANYGPYKIMEIFEPSTMKSLGRTVCHKDTCEAFLQVK